MTRFVLDKNPNQVNTQSLLDFIKFLESNSPNLIMHADPFLKTNLLSKLTLTTNLPIIYLDFDLLFSGYISSKSITQNHGMMLYQPNRNDFLKIIKSILLEISEKKSMLIIDSLNGLFNFFHENKEAGRLVNSYIMLFCSFAKMSNSCILISGMSRRKNNEEWVLSITGRHIFETKQMNTIWIERQNSRIIAKLLDDKALPKKTYEIPIPSELI
jgi:hypothetical protein